MCERCLAQHVRAAGGRNATHATCPTCRARFPLSQVRRVYIDSGDAQGGVSSRERVLKERNAQLEAANRKLEERNAQVEARNAQVEAANRKWEAASRKLREEGAAQERRAERYKAQLHEAELQLRERAADQREARQREEDERERNVLRNLARQKGHVRFEDEEPFELVDMQMINQMVLGKGLDILVQSNIQYVHWPLQWLTG